MLWTTDLQYGWKVVCHAENLPGMCGSMGLRGFKASGACTSNPKILTGVWLCFHAARSTRSAAVLWGSCGFGCTRLRLVGCWRAWDWLTLSGCLRNQGRLFLAQETLQLSWYVKSSEKDGSEFAHSLAMGFRIDWLLHPGLYARKIKPAPSPPAPSLLRSP